jgi:hypothetical protein
LGGFDFGNWCRFRFLTPEQMCNGTRGIYCTCGEAKQHIHVDLRAGVAALNEKENSEASRNTLRPTLSWFAKKKKKPKQPKKLVFFFFFSFSILFDW